MEFKKGMELYFGSLSKPSFWKREGVHILELVEKVDQILIHLS